MNDGTGRTPWWDFDPEERPVPMSPGTGWEPADDAELIVNAEREAILREDTEPSIVTLAQLAAEAESPAPRGGVSVGRRGAVLAAVGLTAACVAMFILGWAQGRAKVSESVSPVIHGQQAPVSMNGSDSNSAATRKGGEA